MNEKQKAFADDYIVSLNAMESYRKVYKNCKNEDVVSANSSRLLANASVRAYVDERLKEISNNKIAQAEEVLSYLTKVMRGETVEETVIVEGVGNGFSEARVVNKIPSEKDRLKAAELLGKRYRLFIDKQEVSGSVSVVFEGEEDIEE